MSAGAAASPTAPVLQLWRWVRNPAFWLPAADVFAVLTALVLPWSTSLVAIFALCWLGSTALFVDYGVYGRSLKQPICALPFAMFALAVVGTLWSDASWGERLYAISPAVKLLFLPGLFYHFERSSRGTWVFTAFLVSCVAMTLASWSGRYKQSKMRSCVRVTLFTWRKAGKIVVKRKRRSPHISIVPASGSGRRRRLSASTLPRS